MDSTNNGLLPDDFITAFDAFITSKKNDDDDDSDDDYDSDYTDSHDTLMTLKIINDKIKKACDSNEFAVIYCCGNYYEPDVNRLTNILEKKGYTVNSNSKYPDDCYDKDLFFETTFTISWKDPKITK